MKMEELWRGMEELYKNFWRNLLNVVNNCVLFFRHANNINKIYRYTFNLCFKKCSISILINSNWKVNRIQCENTGNKPWINETIKLMKVAYLHQFQKQPRISDFVNSKPSAFRSKK